jgi:phospholipase/lecithinase/hemolysin
MSNNHAFGVSSFGRRMALLAAISLPMHSRSMCRGWGIKAAAVLIIVGAALLSFAQRSVAQPFDQVIIFGDSNVDSGYYKQLSSPGGSSTFNSLWASAVANGGGAPTTSPGLVNSQILAGFFGLSANPANTTGGTNYATSGAKNTTINNSQTGGFTAAIPTVTQIANYLTARGGKANDRALYFIHSGDNDATYAAGETGSGPYPPDPDSYMTGAADQLAAAISNLHSAGAQHIMVSGLEYDYPGNDATLRALKLLYTQTLWNELTSLGVPFIEADVNSVRLAISANPSLYGFNNINNTGNGPACTQPNGVTSAWALLCSSNPSAPSTWTAPTAQKHLFADDQHLGTAGQQLMADYLHSLIALLTAAPASGTTPLAVSFRATGLSLPLTYTLNFGDQTTGSLTRTSCSGTPPVAGKGGLQCAASASHTYHNAGSYTATLSNASGSTVGIVTITVRAGPLAAKADHL